MSDSSSLAIPDISHILLDIDGTLLPLSFARDTLFPYATNALPSLLDSQWTSPNVEFAKLRDAFPVEAKASREAFETCFREETRRGAKSGCVKGLQGYLFESGFQYGSFTTPFFDDVKPALERWHKQGVRVGVYSAGSVKTQKMLFRYAKANDAGGEKKTVDLRTLVGSWFDTSVGVKNESESYERILREMGVKRGKSGRVLFLSDSKEELKAAREAGLEVVFVMREDNPIVWWGKDEIWWLKMVTSFDQLEIEPCVKERSEVIGSGPEKGCPSRKSTEDERPRKKQKIGHDPPSEENSSHVRRSRRIRMLQS